MGGVLEGVRVLDFGRYIAGPYCATLLAEFGAEVIRVEKRDGSEDRFVAPVGEGGEGALFLQINRNKKCITLNPMKPEGQEVMRRLVKTVDVVVANLPPQTLRAMKLEGVRKRLTEPARQRSFQHFFAHGIPISFLLNPYIRQDTAQV